MRVGIFGGTFDPVHIGHLIIAEQCRDAARLDRVIFVPAARPPHKMGDDVTPFAQRIEMLQLALAGQPAFVIDELEKQRAGPSYTVDTLAIFHEREPAAEFCLIIGADSLHDFPSWYRPDRILELATLLVVDRPSDEDSSRGTGHDYRKSANERDGLPPATWVDMPLIGISSTDLRSRVRAGRSIRFLTPRAVEVYIREKRLYTSR